MKIIVNSKLLHEKIKEAFEVDAHYISSFVNIGGSGTLKFGTKKYQSDVDLYCDFKDHNTDTVPFHNLPMANLYNLLKLLREQPIVVIFETETVRIEQFVVDFL